MKTLKTILTTLALTASIFTASSALANDKPHYTVGTEAGYAPFEYLNEKGEIVGFDIDLMHYICEKMGAECELKNQAFDSLIPNVIFKKIDFAIAGINITAQRLKQVAFSTEYLPTKGWVYVVPENSKFTKVDELKEIAYQAGTPGSSYLKKETNKKPVSYSTFELALLDAKAGRVDAVFLNEEVGFEFTKNPDYKILGDVVHHEIFGNGLAVVINKKNKELKAKIDAAIEEAKKDGTIDKLKAKYGL